MIATWITKYKTQKYKFDREATTNLQKIFGSGVVKRVFLEQGEYASTSTVEVDGSWSGARLLVEFSSGNYVEMSNSEWANFTPAQNVKVD